LDWEKKRGRSGNRGLGMGCSTMISGFNMGFRTPSSAVIKFNDDGEPTVITGLQDSGQGNETMAVQIVSEELGIPMKRISIINADTELTPPDPGNYAMCSTFVSGNAVRCAAADAKEQLKVVVAKKLEANIEDLEVRDGRIFVRGTPNTGMTLKEAVRESFRSQQPVIGKGSYQPDLDSKRGWSVGNIEGQRTGAYTFGAVVVEVEVDRETGHVKVIEAAGAQDVGYALNPMAVEGQNEGSILMGQGMVLSEGLFWDDGLMLNPNFLDYKMPIVLDAPRIRNIIVESNDQDGPYGAKEATETINIAVISAIANAIYDAVGVRIKELPITPFRILAALKEKEGVSRK
jgi:4-hydroxybenzoyl-CoA reductase subunit alpha